MYEADRLSCYLRSRKSFLQRPLKWARDHTTAHQVNKESKIPQTKTNPGQRTMYNLVGQARLTERN